MTMSQAILRKDEWLEKMGISTEWPTRGIPENILLDNAKEFVSKTLLRACDEYHINIKNRPIGSPHYGGHIERLVGRTMGAVHFLPGTTFSNVQQRGDYNSEKKATMIFDEAEKWIGIELLKRYHNQVHSSINSSPIEKWNTSYNKKIDHRLDLYSKQQIFLDFLPFVTRKISREGIRFYGILYWEDVLVSWIGRNKNKEIIKYNPRDLSKLFLCEKNGNYWPISYRDKTHPTITLSELLEIKIILREKGLSTKNEGIIFSAIQEQRELVKNAAKKTKAMRRKESARESGIAESTFMLTDNSEKNIEKISDHRIHSDEDDENNYFDIEDW